MSERALNAVLGGMTAAGASAVLNPIDTLKVRLQALDVGASRASVGAHAARIISREGLVRGLWVPGLGPNMAFLGAMSSLKFGIYGAASGVTCGVDPGQLYHEIEDAEQIHDGKDGKEEEEGG